MARRGLSGSSLDISKMAGRGNWLEEARAKENAGIALAGMARGDTLRGEGVNNAMMGEGLYQTSNESQQERAMNMIRNALSGEGLRQMGNESGQERAMNMIRNALSGEGLNQIGSNSALQRYLTVMEGGRTNRAERNQNALTQYDVGMQNKTYGQNLFGRLQDWQSGLSGSVALPSNMASNYSASLGSIGGAASNYMSGINSMSAQNANLMGQIFGSMWGNRGTNTNSGNNTLDWLRVNNPWGNSNI